MAVATVIFTFNQPFIFRSDYEKSPPILSIFDG